MTLILTALCKDGICVCADKRSQTWTNGILEKTEDNLNKIYKFKNAPLFIYNHGVNKFNGKSWDWFSSEYEKKNQWVGRDLELICSDFKNFIEKDILQQLEINTKSQPNTENVARAAFVLCGKNFSNNKFEFHELYWSPKFTHTSWIDTRLIGSGIGYERYLNDYLMANSGSTTTEFWGASNTILAKEELKKLFLVAVDKKRQSNGNEFSDNYDLECIT